MNEMRVFEVVFPALDGQKVNQDAPGLVDKLAIEAIAANTTANLSRIPGEEVRALGNPTEGALLLWLENQGVDYVLNRDSFPITYQWTFSTERKYMGTLGTSNAAGGPLLHIKGAPEIVMARCSQWLTAEGAKPLDDNARRDIAAALKDYQARGMRTLGFAYHEAPRNHDGVDIGEVATEMTWLGFAAIADPVRPEVPPAIQACRKAGIQVKVVTGDNQETAQEIARQIGLWEPNDPAEAHIGGQEFGKLTGGAVNRASVSLKILSRARPEHKQKLVGEIWRLLQRAKAKA
ncbi:MAG: HAD family hydrolase [Gammaproteobacteria bacterium]